MKKKKKAVKTKRKEGPYTDAGLGSSDEGVAQEQETVDKPVIVSADPGGPEIWPGALLFSLDDCKALPWNPNVMSDVQFNRLVQRIERDGFDEPLTLVKDEADGRHWIVSGEHRWKAARILGMEKVPAVVRKMEEVDMMVDNVNRNLVRGNLDDVKATNLIKQIQEKTQYDIEKIRDMAGFEDEAAFRKVYKPDTVKDEQFNKALEDSKKEGQVIENLSFLLNEIFSQYGETVPLNFVFFMFKGKMHLMVQCDQKTTVQIEDMADAMKRENSEINGFIASAIKAELDKRGWQSRSELPENEKT